MRKLHTFKTQDNANRLSDFLYVRNIQNQVEEDNGESWILWIIRDEKLDESREVLTAFLSDSTAPEFSGAGNEAQTIRLKERKDQAVREKQNRKRETAIANAGKPLVTFWLIGLSIAVTLLTNFGKNQTTFLFLISTLQPADPWWAGLIQIKMGQAWRLVTPIFLHFGWMHIIFNMMWLKDLGGGIERALGRKYLLLLVLALAVFSNLVQFAIAGPVFGGMSGVVYGLLGYIWIRGKFDPWSPLVLHPHIVNFMLLWFFLCLSGWIGQVANGAHAGGLVLGIAWGYYSAKKGRLGR